MPRVDVHSRLLQAAAYQEQTALLELEFRDGTVYRYGGVPAWVFPQLLGAESKGRYFNDHIRSRFAYTRMHPARRDSNALGATEK